MSNGKNFCLLSTDNLENFVVDDELVYESIKEKNWNLDVKSWHDKSVDWNNYDAVMIRTTWDYQQYPAEFFGVLETIDRSNALLINPLEIVRWNINKKYLLDLAEEGVKIPPTVHGFHIDEVNFDTIFEVEGSDSLIIKPTVSANADHTYWFTPANIKELLPKIKESFKNREFFIQPFLENVIKEGEYSLIHFGGKLSHTVLKTPKTNDFRVQEEHGGIITSVQPAPEIIKTAENVIAALGRIISLGKITALQSSNGDIPFQVRVDLVRNKNNEFELMELEMIEPSLYFRTHADSVKNFVEGLEKLLA